MDLKREIIRLLMQAKETEAYFNPHFLHAILSAFEEVYGENDELLEEWADSMWDR